MDIVSCEERLKRIVVLDKMEVPSKITKIIKAEMLYLLKNFFEISSEDLDINISLDKDRRYVMDVKVVSKNIKNVRTFS